MSQYPSTGLSTILNDLVSEGNKVLDLGTIAGSTSDAFLNLKCECYFEDLGEYIQMLAEDSSCALEKLEAFLVPKPESVQFDFLLTWDLFNYLDMEIIAHLMKLLDGHLKPGTVLHTMQYIGTTQPAKPRSYRLLANHQFEAIDSGQETRVPARGHLIVDLLKNMDHFNLSNTMMNQQGMEKDVIEYLLEYDRPQEETRLSHTTKAPLVAYFKEPATYTSVLLPQLSKTLFSARLNRELSVFSFEKMGGEEQAFLKRFANSVYTEDIYASITWNKSIAVGGHSSVSNHLLKFSPQVKLDLVLLWDLFNYCDPDQVQQILAQLIPRLAPNARLHLLLFNHNRVAERPARFHINEDLSVDVIGKVKGQTPSRITSTGQLTKLMPEFRMQGHFYGWFEEQVSFHEFVLEYTGRSQ